MKHNHLLTAIFTLISLTIFSACGSNGNSSDTQLVEGSVQGNAPYIIYAHGGTTAVVHAQGNHSGTHSWTQTSGPAVTLTTTTAPTTTFTVPNSTSTPIVLQHTNAQMGVTTVTHHTIVPVLVPNLTPTPNTPLVVIVGKAQTVFSGDVASLHASAYGGTPPYTYDWIAPGGIFLDTTHPTAPTFIVPSLPVGVTQTINVGLQVMDANGNTVSSNEAITIKPKQVPPLTLDIIGNNSTVKAGDSVKFTAVATGGDPKAIYVYSWYEVTDPNNAIEHGPDFLIPGVETSPRSPGDTISYIARVETSLPSGASEKKDVIVTITIK